MTGIQFERKVSKDLFDAGYWVLNVPRNESGAQPFDILAIKGNKIIAADCKVCEAKVFPLSRIEPNQWTAFKMMWERASADICVFVWHEDSTYWISYWQLLSAKAHGMSILISELPKARFD